ncbi:MAG: hypothetical protein IPK07_03030 [Deltaproteobacteria bacterium]|nr:hypothetical protein [Deltaproteobacteria bacterium]
MPTLPKSPRGHALAWGLLFVVGVIALGPSLSCDGSSHTTPPPVVEPYPALSAGFHVGYAEERIPFPVGVGLAGYGGRYEGFVGAISGGAPSPPEGDKRPRPYSFLIPPSIGIHTPPLVRTVAMTRVGEGAEDTVVEVRIDMIAPPNVLSDEILRLVRARSGRDLAGKMFLSASHTHASGGRFWDNLIFQSFGGLDSFNPEIFTRITRAAAESIDRAMRDREPASLGVGFDRDFDPADYVFHDRRFENNDDDLVDNADPSRADPITGDLVPDGQPDGRIKDRRLVVVRVNRADGTPKLAIVNFPIHGTALTQKNLFYSTDVIGMIETKTRERLGVPVVHVQGSTGDIQPAEINLGFQGMERIGDAAAPVIARLFDSIETTGAPTRMRSAIYTFREDRQRLGYDSPGNPYPDFDAPFGAIGCGIISDLTNILPIPPIPGVLTPFQCLSRPATYDSKLLQRTLAGLLFGVLTDDFQANAYTDDLLRDIVVGINPEQGPYEEPGFLFYAKAGLFTLEGVPVTTLGAGRAATRDLVLLGAPGEPTTPWSFETRRKLALAIPGVTFDDAIVLGYTTDHNGYILNQEDWVLGGSREIQINPWGPLWGEFVRGRELELAKLVWNDQPVDPGPPIPTTDPVPYLPPKPSRSPSVRVVTQPVTTARFGEIAIRFLGGDPIVDTPHAVGEHRAADGSWAPTRLPGGRVLDESAYETILVYDWDETDPANPHLWSLHWELTEHDAAGTFRIRVQGVNYDGGQQRDDVPYYGGEPYELVSEEFEVVPTTAITIADVSLGAATIALDARYPVVPPAPGPNKPSAFRSLPESPARLTYHATFTSSAGASLEASGTLDSDGNGDLPSPLDAGTYDVHLDVEDDFGNTGAQVFRSVSVGP